MATTSKEECKVSQHKVLEQNIKDLEEEGMLLKERLKEMKDKNQKNEDKAQQIQENAQQIEEELKNAQNKILKFEEEGNVAQSENRVLQENMKGMQKEKRILEENHKKEIEKIKEIEEHRRKTKEENKLLRNKIEEAQKKFIVLEQESKDEILVLQRNETESKQKNEILKDKISSLEEELRTVTIVIGPIIETSEFEPLQGPIESTKENSEQQVNLGILHKVVGTCLPNNVALVITILIALLLNLSDESSDLTLSVFLYQTGFESEALIVFLTDYGGIILFFLHYFMVSIKERVPFKQFLAEVAFLMLIHPLTPSICHLVWLCALARGSEKATARFHFISKVSSLIAGLFEAPMQIIITSWLYITGRLESPLSPRTYCDTFGNCANFGNIISLSTIILSFVGVTKNALDAAQGPDFLGVLSFHIPNLLFRLMAYIILFPYIREYMSILLLTIFFINFFFLVRWRGSRTGLNLFSSSVCAVFVLSTLPEDPSIQERTGRTNVDAKAIKRIVNTLSFITLPLILIFAWVWMWVISGDIDLGWTSDDNISFNMVQLKYSITYLVTGLGLIAIISTIFHKMTYTKDWTGKAKICKIVGDLLILLATIGLVALVIQNYPVGPNRFFLITGNENSPVKIYEGFSYEDINSANCPNPTIHINTLRCQDTNYTITSLRKNHHKFNKGGHKIGVLGSVDGLAAETTVDILKLEKEMEKEKLNKLLQGGSCTDCNQKTNICYILTRGLRQCSDKCEPTISTLNNFSIQYIKPSDHIRKLYSKNETLKVKGICHTKTPFFIPGKNIENVEHCNRSKPWQECQIVDLKCEGSNQWSSSAQCTKLDCLSTESMNDLKIEYSNPSEEERPYKKGENITVKACCPNFSPWFFNKNENKVHCQRRKGSVWLPDGLAVTLTCEESNLWKPDRDIQVQCTRAPNEVLWVGPTSSTLFDVQNFTEISNRPGCGLPDYPGDAEGTVSQMLNGSIYVCGLDGCRIYRSGSGGQWTEPDMRMVTPRRYAASTSAYIGGKITWVVMGGLDENRNTVETTEVWSPGDEWAVVSSLTSPLHVSRHCIVSLEAGIMQIGGSTGGARGRTGRCFIGKEEKASMRTPRGYHACAATSSYVIVAGGWISGDYTDSVEIYETKLNIWKEVHKLPGVDDLGKLTFIHGQIIYVGGRTMGSIHKTNITDLVESKSWEKVANIGPTDFNVNRMNFIVKCDS